MEDKKERDKNEEYQQEEEEEEEYEDFEDKKCVDEGNINEDYDFQNNNRISRNNYYFMNFKIDGLSKDNRGSRIIGDHNYTQFKDEEKENINNFKEIGELIFSLNNLKMNHRNKTPNIKRNQNHLIKELSQNKILVDKSKLGINCGMKKIKEINKVNEVYVPPSEIIPLTPIFNIAKSICKIIIYINATTKKFGTGFLINLSSKENPFYCLMTNEHVINKSMIQKGEFITFIYDIERQKRTINLRKRIIKEFNSNNMKIDATVIQILPEDKISPDFFLLPNYDHMHNFNELESKEITIFHYPAESYNSLCLSNGSIIDVVNNEFSHSASTEMGSSGSPIFLKDTPKVIGIHTSGTRSIPRNYGYFIGPIYQYFSRFKLNKSTANLFKNIRDDKFVLTNYGYFNKRGKSNNKRYKKKRKMNPKNKNVISEVYIVNDKNERDENLMEKNKDNFNGNFNTTVFNGKKEINILEQIDNFEKTINYDDLIQKTLRNGFK